MARVTCFRCDICGTLYEDNRRPKWYITDNANEVSVNKYSRYPSIDQQACSDECATAAIKHYCDEYTKKQEEEAAEKPKDEDLAAVEAIAKD